MEILQDFNGKHTSGFGPAGRNEIGEDELLLIRLTSLAMTEMYFNLMYSIDMSNDQCGCSWGRWKMGTGISLMTKVMNKT